MISESKIFSMQTQQNNIYKLIFAQKHNRAKFEGVTTASSIHLRSCRFICHIKDAQYFKYFDCITSMSSMGISNQQILIKSLHPPIKFYFADDEHLKVMRHIVYSSYLRTY